MNRNQWIAFFFGTPRRALVSVGCWLVAMFLAVALVSPETGRRMAAGVVHACEPLVTCGFTILVMWVGFRLLAKGFAKKKK